jgi:hypothetical protein
MTITRKSIKGSKPVMLDLYKKAKVAEMKDVTSRNKDGQLMINSGDKIKSEVS